MRLKIVVLAICLILFGMFLMQNAAADKKTDVEISGFLGDYSKLEPGKKGEAQLLYINPDGNFRRYKEILMDPITVYAWKGFNNLDKIPEDELRMIVNYLDATVRDHLDDDYKFVAKPGPDVMRLRIAITDAKGANVIINTTSTVTPIGLAISGLKKAKTGASTGVGRAAVEMELADSMTGERLAAAVDERVGTKLESFRKWQGVKEAYDSWAEKLEDRLEDLREK